MYKKLIALMLALIFVISLAACRSDAQSTEPTGTEEPTEVTSEPIPGLDDYDGDVNLDDSITDESSESTEPENESTDSTEATDPEEDPTETTTPSEEVTEPTEEPEPGEETVPPTEDGNQGSAGTTAYEDYINMTGDQQLAFMQSFDSMEAFFAWLNAAKAEYEAQNPGVDVGDGNIDLGGGN